MHVVRQPLPPFLAADGALEVHGVPADTDNLVWLAVCRETGEAAVVDGPGATEVLAYAEAHGIRITAVWNTHTHGDHIGINRALIALGRLPATVVGPAPVASAVPGITRPVDEGDRIRIGLVEAAVWRTEGHLAGHVSYVCPGVVFCGDTLFAGGCGRVFSDATAPEGEIPAGHRALFGSLMRLAELPADTRVCCAHEYTLDNLRFAWSVESGNPALAERIERVWPLRAAGASAVPSTIGEERATNPFLRPGSREILDHLAPADRRTPLAAFTALRRSKDQGAYKRLPEPHPVPGK